MDRQLVVRRRALERERARFEDDELALPEVDRRVHDSWLRCSPQLPPSQYAAPLDDAAASDRWDASPHPAGGTRSVGELRNVAEAGDLVAAVTDETGRILWSFGGRTMRNRAETVNFTAGGRWDEGSAGTNAVALALITGRPSTVFSAEHWCAGVQDWVCYSAPVHDPAGRQVGVIDLSSTWDKASPLGLTTVSAMARVVEQQLRLTSAGAGGLANAAHAAHAAASTLRAGRPAGLASTLELDILGPGAVRLDGVPVPLTRRQVEALAVLACVGWASLDTLHTLLYGERRVSPTTTKVEVSRLRRALGGIIASRPYRVSVPVELDLARLLQYLSAGDLAAACALYRGQVLPTSDAPLLVERRHHCDVALRTAVLHAGITGDLLAFATVHPFDVPVLEAAVSRAAPGDPLLAAATAQLAVALADAASA